MSMPGRGSEGEGMGGGERGRDGAHLDGAHLEHTDRQVSAQGGWPDVQVSGWDARGEGYKG